MKLRKCKDCGGKVSKSAKACPHCGAKLKSSGCFTRLFKVIFYIILVIIILSIIANLLDSSNEGSKDQAVDNTIKNESNQISNNTWLGTYVGSEMCSEGRGKNQWSNPYVITIYQSNNEYKMRGIYFQSNESINLDIQGSKLLIPEQHLGNDSFIIRGEGELIANRIIMDYEVDVLVNFNPEEYLTNRCNAEFLKD